MTNLVGLVLSALGAEEAAHLLINLVPGDHKELCNMVLDCCSEAGAYLLGQRLCIIDDVYRINFESLFVKMYSEAHGLLEESNVVKFFAHLLAADALPWHVLGCISLSEHNTTPSKQIFVKCLFQELADHLGLRSLNGRLSDPALQGYLELIFPRDDLDNTRFAINFLTGIGLGGITENLREYYYLENHPELAF